VSALKTETPCCYCGFSILSSFFFFFLFHSLTKICALFSGNKRDRIKTLTQLAEWSLLMIDYSDLKSQNYSCSNYAKHCSEAVCTLLLHAASAVTAVACLGPADSSPGNDKHAHADVASPASPALSADISKNADRVFYSETLECNPL